MSTETLNPTTISADLRTRALPRTVRCYGAVGSTMDLARELLASLDDSDLPALLVADEQTSGRGRMGRPWVAPAGSALLTSLALRPTWLAPARSVALVWMAAVALCEAVEAVTPLRPRLKWPNDLLVAAPPQAGGEAQWAKAAGILLELTLGQTDLQAAIIGCGINVSAAPPPEATSFPATSLAAAAGAPVSRLALLRAYLQRADAWYASLQAGDEDALFAAWEARLITPGQEVQIETPAGPVAGHAEGVDRSGALLVRDPAGALHTITVGDVGLVDRPAGGPGRSMV